MTFTGSSGAWGGALARNRDLRGRGGRGERWVPRGDAMREQRPDDGESDDARVAGAGNTHLRLSAGLAFDMTPASSCVRRGRAGARRRMHESREVVALANGKTQTAASLFEWAFYDHIYTKSKTKLLVQKIRPANFHRRAVTKNRGDLPKNARGVIREKSRRPSQTPRERPSRSH